MKIVLEIVLVGFLAVTFGEAFYMVKSKASDEVDKCYDSFSAGNFNTCFDVTKAESCFKKIDPANDEDEEMLDGVIKYMQKERESCPGFKTVLGCRVKAIAKCDSSFRDKDRAEDESICADTKDVLACIQKELKDFCTDEAIRNETAFAEGIDKECKAGTIYKGECTDKAILACSDDVYGSEYTDANGEVKYTCKSEFLADALKCLAEKRLKCKSEWSQFTVDVGEANAKEVCRSSH